MLRLVWYVWVYGGYVALAMCCTWAFWRGGTIERIGAALIGVGWIVTSLVSKAGEGPNQWVLLIDCIAFAAFLIMALWSRRLWVFFATALLLNSVISHFVHDLTTYGLYAYATVTALWGGWALLACLVWGILDHRHLQRRLLARNADMQTG